MKEEAVQEAGEGSRIANVAHNLHVGRQTINMNGKPTRIQELPLEELEKAEELLHRVSVKHESKAILPIVAAITLMVAMYGVLHLFFSLNGVVVKTNAERMVLALPGLLIAGPIWIAFYDSRRRHRAVVRAAENRWAEIVVEIAVRRPHGGNSRPPKKKSLFTRGPALSVDGRVEDEQ